MSSLSFMKWTMRRLGAGLVVVILAIAGDASAGSKVRVKVDPRIELISIVQYLADYDSVLTKIGFPNRQFNEDNFQYKTSLIAHFQPQKNHPAVLYYREMLQSGCWLGAPVEAILHFSDPPALHQNSELSEFPIRRCGGKDQLLTWVAKLREFARDSQFESFRKSQARFYDETEDAVYRQSTLDRYVGLMEAYYGYRQNSYSMLLAPLYDSCGFGPRTKAPNGRFDVYYVAGMMSLSNGSPRFGDGASLRYMVWHEFSHPFVNHLVDRYYKDFQLYESLFPPIEPQMRKNGYGDWNNVINEHLVDAVNVRLYALDLGSGESESLLKTLVEHGFLYLPALCDRLKLYESQRGKYRTLDDFFPEFVQVFNEIQEKSLPGVKRMN